MQRPWQLRCPSSAPSQHAQHKRSKGEPPLHLLNEAIAACISNNVLCSANIVLIQSLYKSGYTDWNFDKHHRRSRECWVYYCRFCCHHPQHLLRNTNMMMPWTFCDVFADSCCCRHADICDQCMIFVNDACLVHMVYFALQVRRQRRAIRRAASDVAYGNGRSLFRRLWC